MVRDALADILHRIQIQINGEAVQSHRDHRSIRRYLIEIDDQLVIDVQGAGYRQTGCGIGSDILKGACMGLGPGVQGGCAADAVCMAVRESGRHHRAGTGNRVNLLNLAAHREHLAGLITGHGGRAVKLLLPDGHLLKGVRGGGHAVLKGEAHACPAVDEPSVLYHVRELNAIREIARLRQGRGHADGSGDVGAV